MLASLIPLFYPTIPPLVDLPGHMGRYKVELNYDSVPALRQFYSFHWQLIGNLGVDLLIIPMAKLFGLELGTKLIVMGIIALTVTGLLWIAREVHWPEYNGRVPPTAFFALPLAYSHPFMFGFVNYCLTMALALNALALWLRFGRLEQYRLRALVFLLISPALWISHIYGWAMMGLMCGVAELSRQHDRGGDWLKALGRAVLQCLVLAPPLLVMIVLHANHIQNATGDWFNISAKILWWGLTLRDTWMAFDIVSVCLLLTLVLLAALNEQSTYSRRLAFVAAMLFVAFLILPFQFMGSNYADMRLTPYILALALVAIRPKPETSKRFMLGLVIGGLAFFAIRTAGTTISFLHRTTFYARAFRAVEHIPENARLVSFVENGCGKGQSWQPNYYSHIPAIALIRRNAFSNDQWDAPGAQLMRIIYPYGPEVDPIHYRGDPSQMTGLQPCPAGVFKTLDDALSHLPRDKFDYVWLINISPFKPENVQGLTKIWSEGPDALYRIDNKTLAGSTP